MLYLLPWLYGFTKKLAQFEEILSRLYLPENTRKILQLLFQKVINQI